MDFPDLIQENRECCNCSNQNVEKADVAFFNGAKVRNYLCKKKYMTSKPGRKSQMTNMLRGKLIMERTRSDDKGCVNY